jgi:nucleoid-associated protein YgaU
VLLALGSGGCSSSKDEDSEDLESSDQQGQQDDGEEKADNQQGQQGGDGENFSADNMESTGNEAAAGNATGDQAAQGGNDLQEIISEMDQGNPNAGAKNEQAAAPVNAVPAEAPQAAAMAAPAAAPMADTSTTSAGGLVGGLAGNPAGAGLPELGSKIPYIVRAGDTLAKISSKVYGSVQRWKEIATLTGLDDPNHIYPGDVVYFQLTAEAVGFAQAYLNVTRQEIVVQQGDTLATISKRAFGSPRFWKSIWRENDHITNPDQLVVGQTVFYVTEANMSAAVENNDHEILNPNLNSSDDEVALELLDAQLDNIQTPNEFDFETVDMDLTGELITINFGHGTAQNTVSLNS